VLPTFKRENYRRITVFGGKVTITTLVEAISGSMDTILLGRLVSPWWLGIYNRSTALSQQPIFALSTGLSRVFHPSIARAAERTLDECRIMLENSERQLMAIVMPACIGAAVAGPTIIPVVLGRQWAVAIPVYQVLCIDAALDATYHLPTVQLEVLSLFRNKLIVQALYGTVLAIAICCTARYGIVAVACVHPVLQLIRTLFLHSLSARSLKTGLWTLLSAWFPGLTCGIAAGIVIGVLQRSLMSGGGTPHAIHLVILIAAGALVSFVVYRTFYRHDVYQPWMRVVGSQEPEHETVSAV
jgi:O-antigen/teichoic acid export membrane protein